MSDSLPTFERTALETHQRAQAIFVDRGENYGDTWHLENQVRGVADATLRRFGILKLTPEEMRLLQLAVLCDVKDSRLSGKWSPDHIDDGINYRAAYCTLRDEYERDHARVYAYCLDHSTHPAGGCAAAL